MFVIYCSKSSLIDAFFFWYRARPLQNFSESWLELKKDGGGERNQLFNQFSTDFFFRERNEKVTVSCEWHCPHGQGQKKSFVSLLIVSSISPVAFNTLFLKHYVNMCLPVQRDCISFQSQILNAKDSPPSTHTRRVAPVVLPSSRAKAWAHQICLCSHLPRLCYTQAAQDSRASTYTRGPADPSPAIPGKSSTPGSSQDGEQTLPGP